MISNLQLIVIGCFAAATAARIFRVLCIAVLCCYTETYTSDTFNESNIVWRGRVTDVLVSEFHVSRINRVLLFLCRCRRAVGDAGSSLSDRIYADLMMTIQHGSLTPYLCFGESALHCSQLAPS